MSPLRGRGPRALRKEARAEMRDAKVQLRQNLKSREWRTLVASVAVAIVGYFAASLGLTFFQKSLISVRK